ncbi:PIR Superfamily Protein [Plasmodium ovale wallikeri]|uniref:PIR Superfamily Protein n=1 Tax=Plasmodium ovale wallikeri TaxID=864142 RepID=A0A1A9AQR6_PLAOA|nr:PIR Superfamily Protein [Plasmodium ovale wallikeri]
MNHDDDMWFLNSRRNYKELEKENNKYFIVNEDRCEDLEKELKKELNKDYTGIIEFCKRLGGILHKLNDLKLVPLTNNDYCPVVNYWAYDYLFKNFFNNHELMDNLKFVGVLSKFWKEFVGKKICFLDTALTDEEYFILEKTFYHYILDYENIKLNIESMNFMCTPELKEYLKKGFQAYEKVKGICVTKPQSTHCNILRAYKANHGSDDLLELKCDSVPSRSLARDGQERSDSFGQVATDKGHEGLRSLAPSAQDETSTSPSTAPIAVALPTVGALLTSFIFLKFTPLRSWLHGHLGGNKMLMFNENGEETNTLLDDGYEEYHTYSPMDEHHINYHAA